MCNLVKGFSSELVDLRPNLASAVLSQSLRKQDVGLRRILMESLLLRIPLLWDVKVFNLFYDLIITMLHIFLSQSVSDWDFFCCSAVSLSPPGALFNQSLNCLIIMLIWSETHSGKQWNFQHPALSAQKTTSSSSSFFMMMTLCLSAFCMCTLCLHKHVLLLPPLDPVLIIK